MPLQIHVDHERRLVEVEAIGEIAPRELLDYLHCLAVEEAMPYQKLFDATRSTFNFTDDQVISMIDALTDTDVPCYDIEEEKTESGLNNPLLSSEQAV